MTVPYASNPILQREDTVILLADHQIGLLAGVRDIELATLKHNVVALAKIAKTLNVPVVLTAVTPDMWGSTLPELTDALPGVEVIKRTTVNAWDEEKVRQAVAATGRKQLVVAGISFEVCASLPAIAASHEGYDARVLLDASGTFNEPKRVAGLHRLGTLGIQVMDYGTAAVELLKDNADPAAQAVYQAMGLEFANVVGQLMAASKESQ